MSLTTVLQLNHEMSELLKHIETTTNPTVSKPLLSALRDKINQQREAIEGADLGLPSVPKDPVVPGDREHLPNQLIIQGLPEKGIENDDHFVRAQILEKIGKPRFLQCKISRIGREQANKNRFLLVALENEEEAHDILRKLQNSGLMKKLGKVQIMRDMDKEEQKKMKAVREEIKQKNATLGREKYTYDRVTLEIIENVC
ncbi:hypothetical protein QR680_009138 [Steinernema hermaphroditum]|uniref:Uncharacterized protein n=1 Tax=Steinernema hermaphroditum TaxID=289476 RepID=A0AA39M952_9BILA|nr:hypothetical protein QR680_009138 [Steinernema hermaphroditum]